MNERMQELDRQIGRAAALESVCGLRYRQALLQLPETTQERLQQLKRREEQAHKIVHNLCAEILQEAGLTT